MVLSHFVASSANIEIRPATGADTERFPAVERDSGERFRELPALAWIADDDVMSAEAHRSHLETGVVLSAFVDDTLVGFLTAARVDDGFHLWQMAVALAHQRRGIGTRLIEALQREAVSRGVGAVTLTTFRDVSWNAPFYASLAFEMVGNAELNGFLRDVLAREAAHGIPVELRCAMRWTSG